MPTSAVRLRQDIVDTVSGALACIVCRLVEQATLNKFTDILIGQELVDDVIASHVPLLVVASLDPIVVLEHGMEHLMCHEELKLLVLQLLAELGVEVDPLAIGCSRGEAITHTDFHVERQCADERLFENECSPGLCQTLVERQCAMLHLSSSC